jgi:uncharacterized protein (TIGR00255 family)
MINSMTGFGRAMGQVDGVVYAVEIKTVNNRHFRAYLKLPDAAAFLGEEVEKLLKGGISRGTVNFTLRIGSMPVGALYEIDEEAIKVYAQKLSNVAGQIAIDSKIDLAGLISLPGVVQTVEPDEAFAETVKKTVLGLTSEALENLSQARQTEGRSLAEDLKENCDVIAEKTKLIADRSPVVVKLYHEKLAKRVDDLLAGGKLQIDSDLLAREVAIFADRSDIAEEINRLGSHLKQFDEVCSAKGDVGRRLDFTCQEMLREANTIASKACDAEIASNVIDIKCAIDRLKEQVQNVE